jgi:hypothetical protein
LRVPGPPIKCGTCSQYAVQVPGCQKRLGVVDTSFLGTNQPKAKPAGELTATSGRVQRPANEELGVRSWPWPELLDTSVSDLSHVQIALLIDALAVDVEQAARGSRPKCPTHRADGPRCRSPRSWKSYRRRPTTGPPRRCKESSPRMPAQTAVGRGTCRSRRIFACGGCRDRSPRCGASGGQHRCRAPRSNSRAACPAACLSFPSRGGTCHPYRTSRRRPVVAVSNE